MRVLIVTGVQTCALPIFDDPEAPRLSERRIEGVRDSSVRPRGPRVDRAQAAPGSYREGGPRGCLCDPSSDRFVAGAPAFGPPDAPLYPPPPVPRRGAPRRRGGGD